MSITKSRPERVCRECHEALYHGLHCSFNLSTCGTNTTSPVLSSECGTFSEPAKRPCAECGEVDRHSTLCELNYGSHTFGSLVKDSDRERVPEPVPTHEFVYHRDTPGLCARGTDDAGYCGQPKDAAVHQKDEAGAEYFDDGCVHGAEKTECKICSPQKDFGRMAQATAESEELNQLRREMDSASLGDRPHNIGAKKLRRLMDLESKATAASLGVEAQKCIEHCGWCNQDYDFFTQSSHCPHDVKPQPPAPSNPQCFCGLELEAGICPNGHDPVLLNEVDRRKDAVVDAAVAWHQSGREGDDTWFDKAEVLGRAIDELLGLREPAPTSAQAGPEEELLEALAFNKVLDTLAHSLASITSETRPGCTVPYFLIEDVWKEFWNAESQLRKLERAATPTPTSVEQPEGCELVACHGGDGWCLTVEHDGEVIALLKWPESWPETQTADELIAKGFTIV